LPSTRKEQPWEPADVHEDVHARHAEPEDEARLMESQHEALTARPENEQRHSAAENRER